MAISFVGEVVLVVWRAICDNSKRFDKNNLRRSAD